MHHKILRTTPPSDLAHRRACLEELAVTLGHADNTPPADTYDAASAMEWDDLRVIVIRSHRSMEVPTHAS